MGYSVARTFTVTGSDTVAPEAGSETPAEAPAEPGGEVGGGDAAPDSGDTSAVTALYNEVTRPLADAGPALSETLDAFLDSGGAIEACARKLFVHPNTVRYRLRRIADFTGRDPTVPRDAYVLRVATTVGRLSYPVTPAPVPQTRPNPSVAQLTPPLVGAGRDVPDVAQIAGKSR